MVSIYEVNMEELCRMAASKPTIVPAMAVATVAKPMTAPTVPTSAKTRKAKEAKVVEPFNVKLTGKLALMMESLDRIRDAMEAMVVELEEQKREYPSEEQKVLNQTTTKLKAHVNWVERQSNELCKKLHGIIEEPVVEPQLPASVVAEAEQVEAEAQQVAMPEVVVEQPEAQPQPAQQIPAEESVDYAQEYGYLYHGGL
jgi:hypothetical protein